MTDRTPLKFEYNDTTPSSLAEFTSSDTVPIANGGTAVSSLTLLGESLSSVPVLGTSLSATTVSSTAFTGGTYTGLSVSAKTVSGVTFNGMPYPPPFAYAQLTTDGTAEDAEQNVGVGADITSIESDSNDITWDNTNKHFHVSAVGTYESTIKLITTVAATTNVTIKLKKNTSIINTIASRVHSSIDPTETSLTAVFTAVISDTVSATTTDDGSDDVTANSGTTIILKRLK